MEQTNSVKKTSIILFGREETTAVEKTSIIILVTGSSPRRPLRSHYLVHGEKNSYFVRMGPIRDVELSCKYLTIFPPMCIVSKIGLSTITQICNTHHFSNVVIMILGYFLYPIFGEEDEIMFIYKVFIYLPCINTQQQTTATFYITHVISSSDHQTPRLYQGSANPCEGYRNSNIISLLQPSQTIHYCNQSVLAIVPDLNIFI